jgi:hypothetical protein
MQEAPVAVEVTADGWGALAVAAGDLPVGPATPFPAETLGAAQRPWLAVLGGQALRGPAAPVAGPGWRARLDEAPPSPERDLHLGYLALERGKVRKARKYWRSSIAAAPSAEAYRALGLTSTEPDERADHLAQAIALDANPSLLIEYATAALAAGRAADVAERLHGHDTEGPRAGRFGLLLAEAYVASGGSTRRARSSSRTSSSRTSARAPRRSPRSGVRTRRRGAPTARCLPSTTSGCAPTSRLG